MSAKVILCITGGVMPPTSAKLDKHNKYKLFPFPIKTTSFSDILTFLISLIHIRITKFTSLKVNDYVICSKVSLVNYRCLLDQVYSSSLICILNGLRNMYFKSC